MRIKAILERLVLIAGGVVVGVALVVLGARSNAARFAETRHLFNWLNGSTLAAAGPDGAQQ